MDNPSQNTGENTTLSPPWSPIGYVTYKRTYARRIIASDERPDAPVEEWADTVNRVVRAANEQLHCGFTEDESARLGRYLTQLKGSVAGRFLWQLGADTVDRLGLASLQNCFSGDTEVVTDRGNKRLRDLVGLESIRVLDRGYWRRATVESFGVQPLNEVRFELPGRSNIEMIHHVTPNHRWELVDGTVTSELKVGDRIPLSTDCDPLAQRVGEAFVHGFIFGDGSVNYRYQNGDYSFITRLCGAKEKYKELFNRYYYQPNCSGDPVAYHRASSNYKELPVEADCRYIASFIDGWIRADGSVTASGSVVLSTQNAEAAEWLMAHAVYGGYNVTGHSILDNATNFGKRAAVLHKVVLSRTAYENKAAVVTSINPIGEDEVYCAIVPESQRFTLTTGLITCNCAFTTISTPIRPFTWAFDMLMLGAGVGVNIQREYVYKLPPVNETFVGPVREDNASAAFIVPDTREGWVELLKRTLESAFEPSSKAGFTYSTQLVRGKGAPIKGFGGVASGPEDLVWGIGEISRILEDRRGKQLRPIDCLDIINIIGYVVVSGNVRRSAIIAIGDHDDIQYLRAKRWDLGGIPKWRAMSNNSVVCPDVSLLPDEFWKGYEANGEPYGLINLKLARTCGRIGDTQYKDKRIRGFNPCAEQGLEDYETCCLAEIFLPNISTREELLDVAQLLYRINKHSLALQCHHTETQTIVHKNMRMGIGVTGYLQATEEQRGWLSECYEKLRAFDVQYSKANDFPVSIKLTTVKPSGTLSLLPGVTPGVHPGYSAYMVRRIRIASNSNLVDVCRNHGYPIEYLKELDGSENRSTVVVSFPFSYPEGTILASDVSAIDQLEWVKRLQTEWSDNAVSCTVYYKPEELPDLKAYLAKNYAKNFKSLSFLRHTGHGFLQAPLEEITKEQYDDLVARTTPITHLESVVEFDSTDECASGVCPIK